eukprot:m.49537 g.49537  ORF g.49537 m.49537 type:complete len:145 (-) comp12085_c0_seq1:11-445(-)
MAALAARSWLPRLGCGLKHISHTVQSTTMAVSHSASLETPEARQLLKDLCDPEASAVRLLCYEPADNRLDAHTVSHSSERGRVALLSGSFNPLHEGHREMLKAARRHLPPATAVAYEIAVVNADKVPAAMKSALDEMCMSNAFD